MPASRGRHKLLSARERLFASLIWQRGQIGRREIHQLTGVHPTLTGQSVTALVEARLVRDGRAKASSDRGRPQVPLEIDPDLRTFLGLSISPGVLRVAKIDPTGRLRNEEIVRRVARPTQIVNAAAALLAEHLDRRVHSVGVSFTGLVDARQRKLLFSSSLPYSPAISLEPIFAAAGDLPIVVHNDMHAMALRWLLEHGASSDDVLLVGFNDGSFGASLLIDGQPQRGSVSAGNELGHTRLNVPTEPCYCGQNGCLERIVSTPQLKQLGSRTRRSIDEVFADIGTDGVVARQVLDHLATGLANAVNFVRPAKLVVTGPLVRHASLTDFLIRELPPRILPGLRQRVEIVFWIQPALQSAENAAWLALADVFGHRLPIPRN